MPKTTDIIVTYKSSVERKFSIGHDRPLIDMMNHFGIDPNDKNIASVLVSEKECPYLKNTYRIYKRPTNSDELAYWKWPRSKPLTVEDVIRILDATNVEIPSEELVIYDETADKWFSAESFAKNRLPI